jgi:photosystem II stability/assembly factor-like uncharacterized protein
MSISLPGFFRTLLLLFLTACLAAGCGNSPETTATESAAEWEVIGPGGGGTQYIPTINPSDPLNVLVRCDMTGSYVTEDGGRTWKMFNLRSVVRDFEFDPAHPDTVYAAGTGLYRSEDRGRTWNLVYPAPADITGEAMLGDHASHAYRTRDAILQLDISQVRVAPRNSEILFMGLRNGSGPSQATHLLRSEDRGATWEDLTEIPGRTVLGIFPGSWLERPDEITVITDRVVARVNTRERNLQILGSPAGSLRIADGGVGSVGTRLYLLGGDQENDRRSVDRLFVSADLGETWAELPVDPAAAGIASSVPAPNLETIAASEGNPEIAYLSVRSIQAMENGFPQRHSGILKTTDEGRSWNWVLRKSGGSILTNNYTGGWLYRQLGWLDNPGHLGVSAAKPDVVYGTDSGRTMKSEDGGQTWQQLISEDFPDGSSTSRGLDVTTTYGVHFDPYDREHLFISYTDIGLFHSFDKGTTWTQAIAGIPRQWRNTCYWLEFDPAVRGRIYSVWSNVHDLPRPKMYRSGNLVNGNQQGGVAMSGDGGRWWELLTRGVLQPDGTSAEGIRPGAVCTHIVLDPDSPVQSRTLYVTDYGYGVWKSVNGGRTWELKNRGLSAENLYCWRITRLPSGRLILLVARGGVEDGDVIPGALYSSTDGAETWNLMTLPARVTAPNDLVYDPRQPGRLYLSCWPLREDGAEVGGGLLRSEDCGGTWTRVFPEGIHVYAAAVSPSNPDTVFINTFSGSAYRSDDRGETWNRLEGYDFKWGHRPVPDPGDPNRIYLTTFGGSVFRGPSSGVPGSRETISNIPPSPWNLP